LGVRDLDVAVMVQFIVKSVVKWFGLDQQKLLTARKEQLVIVIVKKGPVPWQLNCVTFLINSARPSVAILCKRVVTTNLSQGIYRRNRSRSNCSVALYFLKSRNRLLFTCSFSYICPPCQTNKPPSRKTNLTKSLEQMNICAQLATAIKQENSSLIWKRGVSDLYAIACQVQV
jgi:hypothetical protein